MRLVLCFLLFIFTANVSWFIAGLAEKSAQTMPKYRRFLPALVCGLIFFALAAVFLQDIFFCAAAFTAGVFLPSVAGRIKEHRKKEKFESQLTDALFVLSSSVKAGSNLLQALENAAQESQPPFSEELKVTMSRIKIGVTLKDALIEFDKRMKISDLRLTVTAINAALEYGGNLSENLFRIAATMRERKRLRDKMKAATAQGRLSAITITALPFLLAVALGFMEREIFGVLTSTFYGKMMLLGAALMSFAGNYFIMKIVRIRQ